MSHEVRKHGAEIVVSLLQNITTVTKERNQLGQKPVYLGCCDICILLT